MISVFIKSIDSGLECAFERFAGDTKVSSAGDVPREGSAMQTDLERLEGQARVNLRVLHLGRAIPSICRE